VPLIEGQPLPVAAGRLLSPSGPASFIRVVNLFPFFIWAVTGDDNHGVGGTGGFRRFFQVFTVTVDDGLFAQIRLEPVQDGDDIGRADTAAAVVPDVGGGGQFTEDRQFFDLSFFQRQKRPAAGGRLVLQKHHAAF